MKPEIVKALKENTSAFGLMSPELQEAAKKIGFKEFETYVHDVTGPSSVFRWSDSNLWDFNESSQLTYRLRADYSPEPDLEKFEIRVRQYGLMYIPQESCQNFPETALREPNFSHFEDDQQRKIHLEDIATYIFNGGKCFVVMRKA